MLIDNTETFIAQAAHAMSRAHEALDARNLQAAGVAIEDAWQYAHAASKAEPLDATLPLDAALVTVRRQWRGPSIRRAKRHVQHAERKHATRDLVAVKQALALAGATVHELKARR